MRSTTTRLALLAAVVVAACGGGDDGEEQRPGPPPEIEEAVRRTVDAGAAVFTLDGVAEVQGMRPRMTGGGFLDPKRRTSRYRVDASAVAAVDPEAGEDVDDYVFEQISIGSDIYVRSEAIAGGRRWLHLDLTSQEEAAGLNPATELGGTDFSNFVDYLRAMTDAKKTGTETVVGGVADRWEGEIDLERYAELVPPERRPGAEADAERAEELTGDAAIDATAWIGSDKRVRRIRMAWSVPGTADIEITMNFGSFPGHVPVRRPRKVIEGSELAP